VAEVAVVGVKHETESQWPRAYIKVIDGKSVTEEELKKFVSGLNIQRKSILGFQH
jgi:acyl-coenzyme A synthetase/AMP-(fatty) acid ligase